MINIGEKNLLMFLFITEDVEWYGNKKNMKITISDLLGMIEEYYNKPYYARNDDIIFKHVGKERLVSDSYLREQLIEYADEGDLYFLYKEKRGHDYFGFFIYDPDLSKDAVDIFNFMNKFKIPMTHIQSEKELIKITGDLDPYLN